MYFKKIKHMNRKQLLLLVKIKSICDMYVNYANYQNYLATGIQLNKQIPSFTYKSLFEEINISIIN